MYNIYSFFSLYANIDGFIPNNKEYNNKQKNELDEWILSELNTLILKVNRYYEDYEPTKVCRSISEFVQEKLSNWYVRLNRRRFWKGEYGSDKNSAYQTLYDSLITITKISAPIAPFYMDHLYGDLIESFPDQKNPESVHLTDFPSANKNKIDLTLQKRINKARVITSLALSLRKKEQIKVRQPLKRIMIPVNTKKERQDIVSIEKQLKSEINVKEIKIINGNSGILVKQIKPNFKILGPRFGKEIKQISLLTDKMTPKDIFNLEQNGEIELVINEKKIKLARSDFEISSKDIEGWLVAHSNALTVALDITLTKTLIEEGIAREFVNRVQNYRKDLGLEVTDTIQICITPNNILNQVLISFKKYIQDETLAESITTTDKKDTGVNLEFDKVKTFLMIKKIY